MRTKPLMTFNQDEFLRGCLMEIAARGGTRAARNHAINLAATYAGKFITDEIQKLANAVKDKIGEELPLARNPTLRGMYLAGAAIRQIASTLMVSDSRVRRAIKDGGLKR